MKEKHFWWLATILWCTLIFIQSSKPAVVSDAQSLHIVMVINHWFSRVVGKEITPLNNFMLRKAAHFTEYLILGFFLAKALASGASLRYAFHYALLAGIIYAGLDEFHQYFVPGRAMLFCDVMLDSAGVLCGDAIGLGLRLERWRAHAMETKR